MTVLSVASVVFSGLPMVAFLNARMSAVSGISSYGAMIFAAVALVVSTAALKIATQHPQLTLEVDDGTTVSRKPTLRADIHRKSNRLLASQSTGHWRLFLVNAGNSSARYPLVRIEFDGIQVKGDVKGWHFVSSSQTRNSVIQWTYPLTGDTVIHPKFPYEIAALDLRKVTLIPLSQSLQRRIRLSITIAADGFFSEGIEWYISLTDEALN